jgi:hypothetical protein
LEAPTPRKRSQDDEDRVDARWAIRPDPDRLTDDESEMTRRDESDHLMMMMSVRLEGNNKKTAKK